MLVFCFQSYNGDETSTLQKTGDKKKNSYRLQ